jgi:hypothetical protein
MSMHQKKEEDIANFSKQVKNKIVNWDWFGLYYFNFMCSRKPNANNDICTNLNFFFLFFKKNGSKTYIHRIENKSKHTGRRGRRRACYMELFREAFFFRRKERSAVAARV